MHRKIEFKFLIIAAFILLILTFFAFPRLAAASQTNSVKSTPEEKRSTDASSSVEPVILSDEQGKYPPGLYSNPYGPGGS
jgi:hypothetical protein